MIEFSIVSVNYDSMVDHVFKTIRYLDQSCNNVVFIACFSNRLYILYITIFYEAVLIILKSIKFFNFIKFPREVSGISSGLVPRQNCLADMVIHMKSFAKIKLLNSIDHFGKNSDD